MEDIAESFLIPAALGSVDALVRQTADNLNLGWGFDGKLTKLNENLISIRALLREAENQNLRFAKQRLMNLKSVISGAENVMDELEYETVRRRFEVRNSKGNKVRDFFSLSNPMAFRLKMVHKIDNINFLIKEVCEHVNDSSDVVQSIVDAVIVGRDRDVKKLKNLLLGSDAEFELEFGLPVIAIVGIPGVGKTTLARIVYNDKEVVDNFGQRVWIEGPNIDGIVPKLQLQEKKFLLVLDGVLGVNAEQWKQVMNDLLRVDVSEESRIMVTTNSVKVVLTMKIPPPLIYQLSPLMGEDSWAMFRKIAFAVGGPRETQSMVQIGKRILEKSKGVPFAIKSLASLAYLSHDESAWMSIYNDEKLELDPGKPGILEQFRRTLQNLPSPSVKQCFAYCAVFPKGHNIKKDDLIQLWTVLGYLHPRSDLEVEDVVGSDYCKYLMDASLFQPFEMDEYQNITSYRIPDDVHDLAVQLYQGYHLTLEPRGRKYHVVADHLSLDFCEEKGMDIPNGNVEMLTALLPTIGVHANRTVAFGLFGYDVEKLPNFIRKFLHLKYLDLSETSITKLPKFITKLYNLQTLKLPKDLIELPKQFHELVSLRHFCMPNDSKTRELMPMKIGQLKCLHTLPFFVVDEGSGTGRSIEELGSLRKLSGRLHIYNLQYVKNREEAKRANISEIQGLLELGFHWYCNEEAEGDTNASNQDETTVETNARNQEEVLEGLQPHRNIQGLILKRFRGRRFPSWMMSMAAPLFLNLVKIELRDCSLCEQVPSLGAFPALRKLTLDGMPRLREWSLPAGSGVTVFFPCLEELYILSCPLLKTIPSELFSSLSLADVKSGKKCHHSLTIKSNFLNLGDMESFMGDVLKKSSKSVVRNLTIRGLNDQVYFPNLQNLASLEKLEIIECNNEIFDIKDPKVSYALTSLEHLSVKQCPNLTQLPEGLVQQTLVTLEIDGCPSLGQVEFGSLTSLQNLMIKGCPRLVSCWKEKLFNMTSLRKLEIGDFSNVLDRFPWPSTTAVVSAGNANVDSDTKPYASTSAPVAAKQPLLLGLRSLGLWGWKNLTQLPEGLQQLTTLTDLSVHSFHSLEALPDWLDNLSSLQSLELHNCKNLAVLPKQPLLLLRQLTIGNCPLLGKSCGKRTGTEWAKIAHIPSVKFSFSAADKQKTDIPAARGEVKPKPETKPIWLHLQFSFAEIKW